MEGWYESFRKYGFIRKLRTHMVYSLQDHANCVVCYIQYMTPSHHLTSKHYSWWYIVSNTRIWPGKKAVATREPCRGGHDLGMNISTSSLDHNPIFWTHHGKLTCCDEVKQQHICAFFLSRGPEKRRHKKVKSSHQVKQSEAHPPLPSMSCTPEQTKGNKPVQKRWSIQSSRQNSNQGNFTAIQYILLELPHGRIVPEMEVTHR